MSDNPFYERGMIRDPARFFGRQRELREIFDLLRTGQNVSIIGDSKIGKSSLLYYIYTTGGDRLSVDYTFIFLDLMRVTNEADFYERVVEELGDAGNTTRQFERSLRGRRVILAVDEFERFKDDDFSAQVVNRLRSLAQGPELTLVLATHQPLETLFPHEGGVSPFYNIFHRCVLGVFTEAEARQLLTSLLAEAAVTFSEAEVKRLLNITGCHPYQLQVATYHLFASRTGGREDWEAAYQDELTGGYYRQTPAARPATRRRADELRVFISSTMSDLRPERQAMTETLWDLELTPIFAEDFGSRPDTPRKVCLSEVAESHIYIGVFGRRYGYITDKGISATEEEYQKAKECGLPILIYVKEEAEENRHVQLRRFLKELQSYESGHILSNFSTPEELQRKVRADVLRELKRMARR